MHVGQYAISTLQLFIMALFSPNRDTKFSWILTVLAKSSVCDNKKTQQPLPDKFQRITFLSLISQFHSTTEKNVEFYSRLASLLYICQ